MKKCTISRKSIMCVIVAILGIVCLWCVVKYRNHIVTKVHSPSGEYVPTERVSEEMMTVQEFVPKYDFVESVGVRILVGNNENEAGMYMTVMDPEFNEIAVASTLLNMMPENGYYHFGLNMPVRPGEKYYIQLQCRKVQGEYPVLAATDSSKDLAENGYYTVDGEIIPDRTVAMEYRYRTPVSRTLILVLSLLVLLLTAGCILLVFKLMKKHDKVYPIGKETMAEAFAFGKKHKLFILWGAVVGFCIVYISLIFNRNIWTDEAYTLDLLRHCKTVHEVFEFTAMDVHPPLYYVILLPFSNLFGANLQIFKLLSILPMVLAMVLGATRIRKTFGARTGLLYILFVGCIPTTMQYSVQIRMYSWALLFVTICFLAALDIYKTKRIRSYVVMGLAGVACAYTQYFTFASALWIYGILFLFLVFGKYEQKGKALLKYLMMCVVSVALYIPWIPHMISQVTGVSGGYWISPITGKVVREYFDTFFVSSLPGTEIMFQFLLVVAIAMIAGRLWFIRREQNCKEKKQLVAVSVGFGVLLLTVLTGVVLSIIIRPIFIIRYAVPCIGLLSLFWAYAFSALKDGVYVLLVCFLLIVGLVSYKDTRKEEYHSTTVHEFLAFMNQNLGDDDYVMYNYRLFDFIYQCYFEEEKLEFIESFDWSKDFDDIWFMDTAYNTDPTADQIAEYGLEITYIGNYSIEHNQFALYRIRK